MKRGSKAPSSSAKRATAPSCALSIRSAISAAPSEKERPKSPEERKVWGLWYELKGYLPEEKRNAAYLAGFAERFGIVKKTGGSVSFEHFEPPEFHKLIEALKLRLAYEEERLAAEVPF